MPSANISNTAPVQLGAANTATSASTSVVGPIDETAVRRAIELYRASKKRAKGPYRLVGADLNGDGKREALVLFSGKDWCTKTGCSMAIFQELQNGFRPISRTVRVKAPIEVSDQVTNTYRDLLVQTGGGPAPERRVKLQFTGEGYSRNAMLQPEVPLGTAIRTEIAIPAAGAPVRSTTGARPPVQPVR